LFVLSDCLLLLYISTLFSKFFFISVPRSRYFKSFFFIWGATSDSIFHSTTLANNACILSNNSQRHGSI
jgi:hypothetical protein